MLTKSANIWSKEKKNIVNIMLYIITIHIYIYIYFKMQFTVFLWIFSSHYSSRQFHAILQKFFYFADLVLISSY